MTNTQDWDRYLQGLKYKSQINLRATVDKNERFYALKHWEGLKNNKLPKFIYPVMNRIIDYKISQILSEPLSMQFSADGVDSKIPDSEYVIQAAQDLSDYSKTLTEKLKLDSIDEDGMLDATLSGDMVVHHYWDEDIPFTGGVKGNLNCELVDNVNYFPGDPNEPRINGPYKPIQPYIVLAFRRNVADVKAEAKANGVSEEDIRLITADSDTQDMAGDMAKKELEGGEKCIVLLCMWYKEGTIWARKSTRSVEIRPEWDMEIHRYPVALFNWKLRKNSSHGEAEATGLINNQIAINKIASQIALWIMIHSFPKIIYDRGRIQSWNNDITQAIGVDGEITGAAQYLTPGQIPAVVSNLLDNFISLTKDMWGANETALGDSSITKTAAGIISLQKAAALPLNQIKRRYIQYREDTGLIWLDFWLTKYSKYQNVSLPVNRNNEDVLVQFDANKLKDQLFSIKIDVGPSTQWSEVTTVQTLDGMLNSQLISPVEYLERMPKGIIPKVQELIDSRMNQDTDKQVLYSLMSEWVQNQPPEIQMQLEQLRQTNPEQFEEQVKQMIMGGRNESPY